MNNKGPKKWGSPPSVYYLWGYMHCQTNVRWCQTFIVKVTLIHFHYDKTCLCKRKMKSWYDNINIFYQQVIFSLHREPVLNPAMLLDHQLLTKVSFIHKPTYKFDGNMKVTG